MSNQPFNPKATLTAKVDASLRGTERGLLVLGTLFLLLFLGSLSSIMYQATVIGYAGSVIGLLGFPALLIQWWRMGERAYQHDNASTTLAATADSLQVITPLTTLAEKVTMVREILHGRKTVPPPYGDAQESRVYSDAERDRIVQETEAEIEKHDAQLLSELERLAPSLPHETVTEPVAAPQAVILEGRQHKKPS